MYILFADDLNIVWCAYTTPIRIHLNICRDSETILHMSIRHAISLKPYVLRLHVSE